MSCSGNAAAAACPCCAVLQGMGCSVWKHSRDNSSTVSQVWFLTHCRTKIKTRLETAYGELVERIPAWITWATQVSLGGCKCTSLESGRGLDQVGHSGEPGRLQMYKSGEWQRPGSSRPLR